LATFADLFGAYYRLSGGQAGFPSVRLHFFGADRLCRALGARAFTVGSDIYFRDGAFAPHTPAGFRLLAHEVAHVVQQRFGAGEALQTGRDFWVAPAGSPEEHEAEAAANALLAGRPFDFTAAGLRPAARKPVVQRYMAWEHYLLGDADPQVGPGREERQCGLLERLGDDPLNVDEDRLRADWPGLETIRLPGSGLVVTLGELNILPDYLSDPGQIESAPAAFLVPLLQSVREWTIRELSRSAGRPRPRRRLEGSLRYPRLRQAAEVFEAVKVDALGRRCGFVPWNLYSSVVGRNAGHFAPFSWYRWHSFHLMARELITRSLTAAAPEREELRVRARIYAGYADHFLQDSYAAGHLINKTLVMQWYIEWLADSPIPYRDRRLLDRVTVGRQPLLYGPDLYNRAPGGPLPAVPRDPQSAVDAQSLADRIRASGVVGHSEIQRREAYAAYLAMLGSTVVQLAASVMHGYFNKRSLVAAAGPDGPRFRLPGDCTLQAGGSGAQRAAEVAAASRRAISELLTCGETAVTSREIFESFPDHVEQDGALVPLRQWHDCTLRDLCFGKLFGLWSTSATKILLSAVWPRLGVPSADIRNDELLR